jgi:hypothetical protein
VFSVRTYESASFSVLYKNRVSVVSSEGGGTHPLAPSSKSKINAPLPPTPSISKHTRTHTHTHTNSSSKGSSPFFRLPILSAVCQCSCQITFPCMCSVLPRVVDSILACSSRFLFILYFCCRLLFIPQDHTRTLPLLYLFTIHYNHPSLPPSLPPSFLTLNHA